MKYFRLKGLKVWVLGHKIVSIAAVLVIVFIVYKIISSVNAGSTAPRYVFASVRRGTISTSITGSGQVSAQNQVDIKSKASGDITNIYVKSGQTVKSGTLLAQIDSRNANISLESAKLTYEKLVKPADPEDVRTADDNVVKAYNTAWNDLSSVFVDYPNIITGVDSIFYSQTGYLSDSKNSQRSLIARDNVHIAGLSFDQAKNKYAVVLLEYNSLSRLSATTSLQLLIDDTHDMLKFMSGALKDTQGAISYIMQSEPDTTAPAVTASGNVNSWLGSVNAHLSTILADQNSIVSYEKALRDLIKGADPLDVRSGQLSLLQSQYNYQDYFIRAPFDGVIARVPAKIGDSGSGATIATIIANNKFATISLNEVDVAKVKTGDKATLSFDAVEDLSVSGEVDSVDLIGTVTQGVVNYNVKVTFDVEDPRIKPGMSVSAEIVTDSKADVLMVPNSAIKVQNGRSYVEILASSAVGSVSSSTTTNVSAADLKQARVETGISGDVNTEIISGLNEGDRVVARTIVGTAASAAAQAPSIFGTAGARARANIPGGGAGAGGGGGR